MAELKETALVMDIINLHGKVQKKIGSTLSIHGLGLSEYLVLSQLFGSPGQKMRRVDLAEQVGLSPSGITRLINPMVKIGLIEKEENPRDARVSLVVLSKAGKRIYQEAHTSVQHASVALLEPFGAKQMGSFSQLLKVIL